MGIKVRRELYVEAPDRYTSERRSQHYKNYTGFHRVERKGLTGESDWSNANFERYSDDNGNTWGEWIDVYSRGHEIIGEDEINTDYGKEIYNPKHGHYVSTATRRIFFGGHHKAYELYWEQGKDGFIDHCLLTVREDGSDKRQMELIKYEDGADYDNDNLGNPAYTRNNRARGFEINVLDNGDILIPMEASIRSCCRIRGLDINEVFPSCPNIMCGLIIARGTFNEVRGKYDLTFSTPIVISDLKSSRGANEPAVIMLPTGRILAVFRGSNVESKNWNTRIQPGTPAHKWYCYSEDGGKSFTDPVPWHYDDREVCYSSSSISMFIKSIKNQKIYWIGNMSDHTAYGNYPRHPLIMAEVNESGLLMKNTRITIDQREEGDTEKVQLSNFSILQNRENGIIEVYLNKLGQHEGFTWWADCYRYFIDVDVDVEGANHV